MYSRLIALKSTQCISCPLTVLFLMLSDLEPGKPHVQGSHCLVTKEPVAERRLGLQMGFYVQNLQRVTAVMKHTEKSWGFSTWRL